MCHDNRKRRSGEKGEAHNFDKNTFQKGTFLQIPNMGINIPNMGIEARQSDKNQPLSMVDALFSKTQQRVLALLYGQPNRSFYATEIINLTGGGSGAVQRELSKLARSGLVNVTRIGSQRHFQANPGSPIYAELCSIIQKTVGLAGPLTAALTPLSKHIDLAFVFGSVAKKTDSASSDIDLMIISDTLVYADVFPAIEEVSHQLSREIQPTIYSKVELNRRISSDNSFVKRVLQQPKIWIIGNESDLDLR
jgi:predicted nucleotidyltransferase